MDTTTTGGFDTTTTGAVDDSTTEDSFGLTSSSSGFNPSDPTVPDTSGDPTNDPDPATTAPGDSDGEETDDAGEATDESGCSCTTTPSSGPTTALALLTLLGLRRRRRKT